MPPAWLSSSLVMVPVRSTHPGFVGALHAFGVESRALLPPPAPSPQAGTSLFSSQLAHAISSSTSLDLYRDFFSLLHKEKSLYPLPSSGCRIWPKASTHPWTQPRGCSQQF